MNPKCGAPQQQLKHILHVTETCIFKWPVEHASNALKLCLGSSGEMNRGPKLCAEYISHPRNFKIDSTFDKKPTQFPCGQSDTLRLPLRVKFDSRVFVHAGKYEGPIPLPAPRRTIMKHYDSASVRSLAHGHHWTVGTSMKFQGLAKEPRPESLQLSLTTFITSTRNNHLSIQT